MRFFDDMGTTYTQMREAFEKYLHDECTWSNQGLPEVTGKDTVLGFLRQFADQIGLQAVGGKVLNIASRGDLVLTERHEVWTGTGGQVLVESLPVMGTFEIKDGKILTWRDYFDPAKFAHLMGTSD
ncbi:MAG: hypothetical protein GEU98_17530 [Pseudonocardiaceae bacterium]|nr:hypothetical protein [Pseudonocardiaceae bacterium]